MVLHAPDEDGRTIELFGNTAEIGVECVARGIVAQKRAPVFGRENKMNVNRGKGLWHGVMMAKSGVVRQLEVDTMEIK